MSYVTARTMFLFESARRTPVGSRREPPKGNNVRHEAHNVGVSSLVSSSWLVPGATYFCATAPKCAHSWTSGGVPEKITAAPVTCTREASPQ